MILSSCSLVLSVSQSWDFRWKLTRNSCVKMIVWFWILGNWPPADQNPFSLLRPRTKLRNFKQYNTLVLVCFVLFFLLKKKMMSHAFSYVFVLHPKRFSSFLTIFFYLIFFLSTGKVKKETWHVFQQACYAWPSLL